MTAEKAARLDPATCPGCGHAFVTCVPRICPACGYRVLTQEEYDRRENVPMSLSAAVRAEDCPRRESHVIMSGPCSECDYLAGPGLTCSSCGATGIDTTTEALRHAIRKDGTRGCD